MAPKGQIVDYTPPPTIREFMTDYKPGELFYDWIIGPVGSGKTTGLFFKLVRMAALQEPDSDGIRRTRAVVVRNTAPQLRDTTLVSWAYWFKDGIAGRWRATEKNFELKFGDVECEVLFRPLDTPDDVARVLSLEVTFAILDEFVKIPKAVVEALSARLGRYPWNATNWGMWGSSNPDNEDNWWFDYLHNNPDVERVGVTQEVSEGCNAKYFVQPSGFSPQAENLGNLPPRDGSNAYYVNQAKGKSPGWIKQFIDAEWGFSAEGTPVVPTFQPLSHTASSGLLFNPLLPLVVGFDPGLGGSAFVFGQEDLNGRLIVFGELTQVNYGSERLINERLKPYLRYKFPDAKVVIAADPAGNNRSSKDEDPIIKPFRKYFTVSVETNNRLPLRLNAIEYYTTRLTGKGVALQVDARECPNLIRALKGGWKYSINQKNDEQRPEPEKNPWSHVGDAFGYLCRYYHKQYEKNSRYMGVDGTGRPFVPPRQFGSPYHFR
jgi:hypothetical protein